MTLKLGEIKIPGRANRLGLSPSPIIDKHCKRQNAAKIQCEGFFKSEHPTALGVIEIETDLGRGYTTVSLQQKKEEYDIPSPC